MITTMKKSFTTKKTTTTKTTMMTMQEEDPHPTKSYHVVDLKLDHRLKPTSYVTYVKDGSSSTTSKRITESLMKNDSNNHTFYALGSSSDGDGVNTNGDGNDGDAIYFRNGDLGLFSAVFEAWKNHWTLRTTPEDWWFPIACRISKAIDNAAKQENQCEVEEKMDRERPYYIKDKAETFRDMLMYSDKYDVEIKIRYNENQVMDYFLCKWEEESGKVLPTKYHPPMDPSQKITDTTDKEKLDKLYREFVHIECPVREMFVNHEGKEPIAVELPFTTIFDANYDDVFSEFSTELNGRIKVPGYVNAMENDFSTSNSTHLISSQINIMSSLQQFFEYELRMCGCGLRGLEMNGTVEDWCALRTKLRTVKELLQPIEKSLELKGWGKSSWWDEVDRVFEMLEVTRTTPDDPKVAEFWINILCDTTDKKYVGGGGSGFGGKKVDVDAYDGWLIKFLLDREKILVEDLQDSKSKVRKELSGYNTVPLKVKYTWCNPSIADETTLLAGIVGYKVYVKSDATIQNQNVPSSITSRRTTSYVGNDDKCRFTIIDW